MARFAEGEVLLLPQSWQQIPGRRIVGATLRARSLGALQAALKANKLDVPAIVSTPNARSIFLPPTLTHGLWLEFREAR